MAQKKNASSGSTGKITALLAAAAGAYWLYGSEQAAKHRKSVKSWMLKARAEMMEHMEKSERLDHKGYLSLVDKVVSGASGAVQASKPEIARLKQDLRAAWKHVSSEAQQGAKKPTPKKPSAKKASKKSGAKK